MSDKPRHRVGVAGLDPRETRLIEIVFRHSRYNRHAFELVTDALPGAVDLLIASAVEPAGQRAIAAARAAARPIPVIVAVPRGGSAPDGPSIAIDRLTLQLLPVLNRVVEQMAHEPQVASQPREPAPRGVPAPPVVAAAPRPEQRADAEQPSPSPLSSPLSPSQSQSRSQPGDPLAAAAAPVPAAQPADAAPTPRSNLLSLPMRGVDPPFAQRLRVLVVDDSPTVRRQLSVAFDRMGIASEAVASAAQALEQLADRHFDLALLDIVMPDMDGYRLTREIRRKPALRQLPIIILTSRSSPFDLARGALAGCDTYLTKPVPFRALEAAVRKQLRRALAIDDLGALVRMPAQPDEAAAAPAPRPGLVARLFGRS
jgi:CheY-like chemotaxis protein